jgi:hypothetical protein
MSVITRRLSERHTERGAAAALVVIVFGAGVLLGLGALVVDAGAMYAERAQLQNGADAGALAVAFGCAKGTATCSPGGRTGALANSNANDLHATVDNVCGRAPGGLLPACPAPAPPGCADSPGPTVTYAQVQTSTLTSGGSGLLPVSFGEALLGSGYDGKTVHACAQASWASVGAATSLSATLSLCSWNAATSNGTVFAPPGLYPPWPPRYPNTATPPAPGVPGGEQVLQLHGSGNDCVGGRGAGWQLPGGFGWLSDQGSNCTTTVDANGIYDDDTGVSVSGACVTALTDARNSRTALYLPVYDGVEGTGANGDYHLAGFAAFVVTGGYLNGSGGGFKVPSTISGTAYCSGTKRCLYGFFTQALLPPGTVTTGGTNFGTSVVRMIG